MRTQVQEIRLEYTDCNSTAPAYDTKKSSDGFDSMPSDAVHTAFKSNNGSVSAEWAVEKDVNVTVSTGVKVLTNRCYLRFTIPESMGPPVLFYYHLTNFYQNHRRYVLSFDADQLKGDDRSYDAIKGSDCTPLYGVGSVNKPYYPCGLIANSMFNDSFSSPVLMNPRNAKNNETWTYHMQNNTNIAWDSDKDLYGNTSYTYEQVLPPPNWMKRYPNNYTAENPPPNLKEWEAFQVWMRTAGLPTFSKLYQRNDSVSMPAGRYQVIVDDCRLLVALAGTMADSLDFPTDIYKGTKSIIITTRTVMGGRNPFLGIAYVVVGGVCILLGAIFTVTHLVRPRSVFHPLISRSRLLTTRRKLGDHTYLSWNNAPGAKSGPSTAVASGRELRPGEA